MDKYEVIIDGGKNIVDITNAEHLKQLNDVIKTEI